jgi:Ca-activated chloride channel family protein
LPFDHGVQRPGTGLKALLNIAATLPPLMLAVAILLLAGPQQLAEPKSKKVMTNIQFCLDVSGSMTAQFGDGNRYEAAMEAINDFVAKREGDAYGLTVFGGHYIHWIRLTNDPAAFKYAMPFLGPTNLPSWFSGGTAIAMALEKCIDVMVEREEGDRMIVLFSDGYSGDFAGGNDARIAAKLAANNIRVYAIHVADGGIPPQIQTVATSTGGLAFSAGDPQGLEQVFKSIDEMAETRIEKISAESMDNFRPYSIAGLSVLGLGMLALLLGVRYTPW